MNKLRAYFRVICALIRSWSDISPSIIRHSHQANSVFGGTKFRAAGSKFRAAGLKFRAAAVIVRTSSKWGKIRLSSYIWPWSSGSITPQNYRLLNQGVLQLCFKFGDSSLNGWWVIVRTSKWLTHTHWQTHRQGRWQYPKAKTGLG